MIEKDYCPESGPNRIIFDGDKSRLLLRANCAELCARCARFRPGVKTTGPEWYDHSENCPGMNPSFSGCIMFFPAREKAD